MSPRAARSLFAVGALAFAWISGLIVDWAVSLLAGWETFFVALGAALVVEMVMFRRRVEPRGFPIEPIQRDSDGKPH